ncbi:MAG: hypothetical protein HYY61_04365 [Deltaproteobacteria bacterium]|nr:hypothetical protein [Deltaproteobacteria bacterium]
MKSILVLLFVIALWSHVSFAQTSFSNFNPMSLDEIKTRANAELKRFTELTGVVSNFRTLAPASPLGIWGFNVGVEVTSLPQNTFQIFNRPLNLPAYFPRFHAAKGLTPNLDAEISLFLPRLVLSRDALPQEIEALAVYGGGLKYTLLREEEFPISLAVRATYNRLYLSFFKSDTYGADVSVSRSVKPPLIPLRLIPYAGIGYMAINGEFKKSLIALDASQTHTLQDYRYFGGLSTKLFIFNLTSQIDAPATFKKIDSVSFKISIEI